MLHETALRSLQQVLPKGQIFTNRASLIAYEVDAGLDKGIPDGVVFPRTVEDVVTLVRWSAEHNVPLVARGAGTGLSGGAVADRGGIIVEFSHMHAILDVDTQSRRATAQPAVINLSLDDEVKKHGLYFPPDPASQRASTIGGNVAENSGGPHCFKYGVTTNYITGLDVVLADGQAIRIGGYALDYPEYDLAGLITGSEGMLALMTAISVRLLRNPPGIKTMLAIFDSVKAAGNAVSAVIAAGLVPATMELMDQKIIGIAEPFAQAGLPLDAGAILIIDVDGYPESLEAQVVEMDHLMRTHGASETRIATNAEERARIWLARKSVAGAITRLTPSYYTVDVTVPRSRLAEVLVEVDQICERYNVRTGYLLHAGDGNLHPMMLIPDKDDEEFMHRVHTASWEMVKCCVDMGGSLTGEHGVGIEKREYMSLMHTAAELLAMWDVKQVFDPQNILNPGKLFPRPQQQERGPFAGYAAYAADVHTTSNQTASHNIGSVFTPMSAAEAAQGLQGLALAKRTVSISGHTPTEDRHADTVLSTTALSGIKTYAPDDLYITVGAGTPLKEIQEFLAKDHTFVPLASPRSETTIGGLVATNSNAPLRMRYGAIRDLVLCGTVALTDGRVIRVGRPIVKNVAGFDLTKAFIGSYGTLGLFTDITLKLFVQPRKRSTLYYPLADLRSGLLHARQVLPLALVASAVLVCKGHEEPGIADIPASPYVLAYTAEGLVEDVETELEQVRQVMRSMNAPEAIESESLSGTDLWSTMLGPGTENAVQVRVGVSPRDLPVYLNDQAELLRAGSFIADMANGFVYATGTFEDSTAAQKWLAALRAPALKAQGYAVVTALPTTAQYELDRWGYHPQGYDLMRRLKQRWDVQGILNPNAWIV